MKSHFVVLTTLLIILAESDDCAYRCSQCNQTTKACIKCQDGYTLVNGKQCKRCPVQCSTCTTDSRGFPVCSSCADKSSASETNSCYKCIPQCQKCSNSQDNCTQCVDGMKLVQTNGKGECVLDSSCNSIPHCKVCLTNQTSSLLSNTSNTSNDQVCQSCSNPFYTFRRGCQRCKQPCSSCIYNYASNWQKIRTFWNDSRNQLLTKVTAASSSTTRLLQGNSNNNNKYTQNYKNWTLTQWNAAKWTKAELKQHVNMSEIDVKSWTQAYYFFKAAQTNLNSNYTLINLMYNALPITQQVLALSYSDNNQWQHFARFLSNFSPKKWNGPILNKKVVQLATNNSTCLACPQGFNPSQSGCVKCLDNCKDCNETDCKMCVSGYYLLNKVCTKCDSNCKQCDVTGTNCTSCLSPLVLSGNNCVTCDTNCKTCNANNISACIICSQAFSAYPNTQGVCYACTDSTCRQCDATNKSNCSLCKEGYALSSNQCTACPTNCSSCLFINSNLTCYQCKTGFTLVNNTCAQCSSECKSCSRGNSSSCQSCQDWQYLSNTQGKCKRCPEGCENCQSQNQCNKFKPGVTIFNNNIVRCAMGCTSCDSTNPAACLACDSRYYLNGTQCLRCSSKCLACTSSTACTSCESASNLINGQCISCANNCSACSVSDSNICTACIRGYTLNNSKCSKVCQSGCISCNANTSSICNQCDRGYGLSTNGKCVRCIGQCSGRCNSKDITQCQSCIQGFFLKNNVCVRCPEGCSVCTDAGCTACTEGYNFNATALSCNKILCLSPCSNCSSGICTACQTGYVLQNAKCVVNISCNPNCLGCISGSYADANFNCVRCPSSCSACPNGVCTSCFDGFYLNTESSCVTCPSECVTCNDNSTCKRCSSGYVKQIIEAGQDYSTIVYGTKCIQCNQNCLTCSIYPKKCTSCKAGSRLVNQKCVGNYTVVYKYQLDYDYKKFLENGQSYNFTNVILNRLSFNSQRHFLRNVRSGSTIVQGTVSANSQNDANQIKNNLQNQNKIGTFNVLSSSVAVALNDQTMSSNSNQDNNGARTAIIVGSVVGGVIVLSAIVFLIYKLIGRRSHKPYENEHVDGDYVERTPYKGQAIPMQTYKTSVIKTSSQNLNNLYAIE